MSKKKGYRVEHKRSPGGIVEWVVTAPDGTAYLYGDDEAAAHQDAQRMAHEDAMFAAECDA